MKIKPDELYELRKAQLEAERLGMSAQLAGNRVRALLLEIERRYEILGTDAKIGIATGEITNANGDDQADEAVLEAAG